MTTTSTYEHMHTPAHQQRLLRACRVIFGSDVQVSADFLAYLQPSGLRDAYRRAALETHPDRARQYRSSTVLQTQRFRMVRQSYELLDEYLRYRSESHPVAPESQRRTAPASAQSSANPTVGSPRWVSSVFGWFSRN